MLYARRFILVVVLLSFCAIQSIAQQAAKDDEAYAVLIDGLGSYSRPISTRSEIAQKFFDQYLSTSSSEFFINEHVLQHRFGFGLT